MSSQQHGEAARVLATCLLRLAEADDDSGLRWWAAQLRLAAGSGSSAEPEEILTPREFEVAALVSQGMTNRQIAAELRISDPTASTHVRNILSKLSMGHRSQIASWVVRKESYARLWDMVSRVADEVASGPDRKPPSTQFERLT